MTSVINTVPNVLKPERIGNDRDTLLVIERRERVLWESVSVFGSCLSGGALMNLALPGLIRGTNATMLTP